MFKKLFLISFILLVLLSKSFVANSSETSSFSKNLKLAEMALKLGDITEAREYLEKAKNSKLSKVEEKKVKNIESKINKAGKKHKIKGKISAGYETHSDIGAAPSAKGGKDIADEADGEEEDDGFNDDEGFDAEDLLDDNSQNDQDLEEIFDESDADGDNQDDLTDTDVDDDIAGGDGFFSKSKDSESRYVQSVNLAYGYLFSEKGHIWNSSAAFVSAFNQDRTELDRRSYAFSTGPSFNIPGYRLRINPTISYVNLVRNDEAFSEAFVYALGFSFKATEKLDLGLKYSYQDRDINNINSPDAVVDTIKLSAGYEITKKDKINFSFSPNFEDSSKFNRNRDTYGYNLGYIRKLPFNMAAGLSFGYRHAELINISPNRQDDLYNYAFQLGKKFKQGFTLSMSLIDQQRKSSIAGKDTRDQAFILNTGWNF